MQSFRSMGHLILVASILVSLCFVAIPGNAPIRAQETSVAADLVPADAVLYLSIDTHLLSPQWVQAGVLAQRINEDATIESIPESVIEQAIGMDVDIDVTPFIGGEIALAFLGAGAVLGETSTEQIAADPAEAAIELADGVVAIAVPASLALAETEVRTATTQLADRRGAELQETIYNDVTITYVEADAISGEPGAAFAVVGDAIALALEPQQLEPIIDRASGDGESIAEAAGFDVAMGQMPDEPLIAGFLNGPALVAGGQQLDGVGPTIEAFIPGGANGVTAFAVTSEPDGFRIDTRTVSAKGDPIRTYGEHISDAFLERLPAQTQVAVLGNDLAGSRVVDGALAIVFNLILGSLTEMFVGLEGDSSATPEPLPETFDETVDAAYGLAEAFLGFDVQSDLVELLDGEFALGVWNAGGENSDAAFGFISETSDPDTVETTLGNISLIAGFLFGGDDPSADASSRIAIDGGVIEFGVTDGHMVIGYGAGDGLTVVPDESLIDSTQFIAATDQLPDDHSLLIFIDIHSLETGPQRTVPGAFGLGEPSETGPAFGFVMFNDGEDMGGQGYLSIPEP